jgi:uncharacterized protein YjbI with pentapeptide repeats
MKESESMDYLPNLEGQDLSKVIPPKANLACFNLRNTRFDGADLSGVDFTGANLEGASFVNCNLKAAKFQSARLVGTDFTNAYLGLCDFRAAEIDRFTHGTWMNADLGPDLFNPNGTTDEFGAGLRPMLLELHGPDPWGTGDED